MARQNQDAFGHVRQLTTVTPINQGGTNAKTKEQAVINLQGIDRSKIGQPLGVASADTMGYLDRKYLEGTGLSAGVAIEGPPYLVKSTHRTRTARLFISNIHSLAYPTVTVDDASVQASMVLNWPYVEFTIPSTGTSLTFTVNGRALEIPLREEGIEAPQLVLLPDSEQPSVFFLEASKFRSLGHSNLTPASWIQLPNGTTTLHLDDSVHTLILEARRGQNGHLSFSSEEGLFTFPSSLASLELHPTLEQTLKLTAQNASAQYAILTSELVHTGTDWQVAMDEAFTNLIVDEVSESTTLRQLPMNLPGGTFYARVRYLSTADTLTYVSDWSPAVRFTVNPELDVLNEYAILTDLTIGRNRQFGSSLTTTQDGQVAVGIPQEEIRGVASGAVVIFQRTGMLHRQVERIDAPEHLPDTRFGQAVAFSPDGQTLFVTAPLYSLNSAKGKVYCYARVDNRYVVSSTLLMPNTGHSVGYSIKATDTHLYIGDPFNTLNGEASGAVYIYRKTQDGYELETTLHPVTPSPQAGFGISLDVTPDSLLLAVGSVRPDEAGLEAGKFYLFTLEDSGYQEAIVRNSPIPTPGALFGRSVCLDVPRQKLYVGTPGDSEQGTLSGSVSVFSFTTEPSLQFTHQKTLYPSEGHLNAYFGVALDTTPDGLRLYIGSRQYPLNGQALGAVYFYS